MKLVTLLVLGCFAITGCAGTGTGPNTVTHYRIALAGNPAREDAEVCYEICRATRRETEDCLSQCRGYSRASGPCRPEDSLPQAICVEATPRAPEPANETGTNRTLNVVAGAVAVGGVVIGGYLLLGFLALVLYIA